VKATTLKRFYEVLPMGLVVLNSKHEFIYGNDAYLRLLGIEGRLESSSVHLQFLDLCRKNRNKSSGTVRLIPEDGEILVFEVFCSQTRFGEGEGRPCSVFSLLPLKNRGKLHKTDPRESYIFDRIRVHVSHQVIKYDGKTIPFSATEFRLMVYLCRNEDRLITKEQLVREVWRKKDQTTRTVDMYISRVRKRLKDAGCTKDYIRTLHGQGYVFQVND
jgi:PAS domain-containing protein